MKYLRTNIFIIILAILAAALWFFGFSKIHYVIYQFLGSPENPTVLLWAALLIQSFLMGAIPGIIAVYFERRPIREVTTLFLSVIIIFIGIASAILGGVSATIELVLSYGTWLFIGGVLIGCFGMGKVKNAT